MKVKKLYKILFIYYLWWMPLQNDLDTHIKHMIKKIGFYKIIFPEIARTFGREVILHRDSPHIFCFIASLIVYTFSAVYPPILKNETIVVGNESYTLESSCFILSFFVMVVIERKCRSVVVTTRSR